MSDLDLENDNSFESSPRFFIPLPRERLPVSTCDIDVEYHQSTYFPTPCVDDDLASEDYGDGLYVAHIIENHRVQLCMVFDIKVPQWHGMSQSKKKNVRRYLQRPGEKSWAAVSTFETRRRGRPHILIRLVSDCHGETRLVKYELIAMTSYMIAMLESQSFPQHPIVPVLIISTLNDSTVRILQGHYDGHLNIRCSKLYNFNVPDHREAMDLIVRWELPLACGDTTLSGLQLSTKKDDEECQPELSHIS